MVPRSFAQRRSRPALDERRRLFSPRNDSERRKSDRVVRVLGRPQAFHRSDHLRREYRVRWRPTDNRFEVFINKKKNVRSGTNRPSDTEHRTRKKII